MKLKFFLTILFIFIALAGTAPSFRRNTALATKTNSEEQNKIGDVSGEGDVTNLDAKLVLRSVVGSINLSELQKQAADVTGDGNVTAYDAALIMQHIAGLITQFPAEKPVIENISPSDAYDLIQTNKDQPNFVILDVRTSGEFASGHIEDAINLNYYSTSFRDDLDGLDKNKTYVIYCHSGSRSGGARNIMEELNFMKVYNILGGITAWKANGLPTVRT